jgi:hypothetical protein
MALTVVGDGETLWLLGGRDTDGARIGGAWALPAGATQWLRLASLSMPYSSPGGTVGPDGKIYVVGGSPGDSSMGLYGASVECYTPPAVDAASKSWDVSPPDLPFGRFGARAATASDAIYVVGGTSVQGDVHGMQRWRPSEKSWADVTGLPASRSAYGFVRASDGRLYAVGGLDSTAIVGAVSAYAPELDHWFSASALSAAARTKLGVSTGPDGRLWTIGGTGAAGALSSVEIYGPHLTMNPVSGGPGQQVQIGGTNFAANATVTVRIDAIDGNLLGTARSDGAGALVAPLQYTVPSDRHENFLIVAMDDKSRFPVHLTFVVQ